MPKEQELTEALQQMLKGVFYEGRPSVVKILQDRHYLYEAMMLEQAIANAKRVLSGEKESVG